ncbi:unnamed protein product [Triticum turgidum subsp. durum]|nr:unnamed protein product [Triticum turgidum subsp. durum]
MPPWWFLVHFMVAVLAVDVQGRHDITHNSRYACAPFSCGHLQDVQYPFRQQGDPWWCGSPSYELTCTDSSATIQINTGTYFVTEIDYKYSSFWVVDANLDMSSSCPLPRWDQRPYLHGLQQSDGSIIFDPFFVTWASFVNCSRVVRNNSDYIPVTCLNTRYSFVYVLIDYISVGNLEPSCGYLAMAALGGWSMRYGNASHEILVESMRRGFAVRFPFRYERTPEDFKGCLKDRFV